MEGELKKSRRRLPHWQLDGGTYFLTFRLATGTLTVDERLVVLNHLRSGHDKFYFLFAAVVMPDHAHAILRPRTGVDLTRIMKGIKGVSARLINQSRGASGALWQDESFDRILRDQAEFEEKLGYIVDNAVKRELVDDPWDYPALFVNEELDG